MIIPKLVGRLGNQCFQISAAIAHAKKVGCEWRVPKQTADPRIWPIYFTGLRSAPSGYAAMHVYVEPRHCYDPLPMQKDMLLKGYFQSEKYFEGAKVDIANAFSFDVKQNEAPTVAMHIRRGDYLQYADQFPVLPIEYYQQAVEQCLDSGYEHFVIYTDDQKYYLTEFGKKIDWYGTYVSLVTEHDAVKSMRHMYKADAFIIANSSFSLFPALLRADNPLVIAPAEHRWYGPKNKHLETRDLMPERFIKI